MRMRFLRTFGLIALVAAAVAVPVGASPSPSIKGGGTTGSMTMFALAITDGRGHFECLMPALMNVDGTATSAEMTSADSASFQGTAFVTLPAGNPLGLPPGRVGPVPFTASATAGGPGVGKLDLKIMSMDFPGTVEHGHIRIDP
jgi:hypothetical protein